MSVSVCLRVRKRVHVRVCVCEREREREREEAECQRDLQAEENTKTDTRIMINAAGLVNMLSVSSLGTILPFFLQLRSHFDSLCTYVPLKGTKGLNKHLTDLS